MTTRRASIIGGSVGGLYAAHLLAADGWDVDVFERAATDLASRGAGIGTHAALSEVMRRLGLPLDDSIGVATDTYVCLDRAGRRIGEVCRPRVMTAWGPLYRTLRDNLHGARYHRGKDCVEVSTADGGAAAVFADGTRAEADVLVAADGVRSTVRSQLLPGLEPEYAGYVCWRAVVSEREVSADTRAALQAQYLFSVPEGEMALCYLVPARDGDMRPGHRDCNLAWYRPADAAMLAELCTDAQGQHYGASIPPPLIRPAVVADFRERARAELAPPLADVALRAEQPFFQAISDLAAPRIVFGRIALLGDAAFVARPHVGAGVTKSALDAVCLADLLAAPGGDIDAALAGYDRQRRRFGEWIVARGRALGASVGMRVKAEGVTSQEERDRRAAAAMSAYAANAEELAGLTIGSSIGPAAAA